MSLRTSLGWVGVSTAHQTATCNVYQVSFWQTRHSPLVSYRVHIYSTPPNCGYKNARNPAAASISKKSRTPCISMYRCSTGNHVLTSPSVYPQQAVCISNRPCNNASRANITGQASHSYRAEIFNTIELIADATLLQQRQP